jgi:AsmA protein
MTSAHAGWSSVSRWTAAAGVIALIGGLALAFDLASPSSRLAGRALVNRTPDGTVIATPLRLSGRFPLTLDGGVIVGSPSESRNGDGLVVHHATLTLDLSGAVDPDSMSRGEVSAKPAATPSIAGYATDSLRMTGAQIALLGPHGARAVMEDVNAALTVTRKGSYKLVGAGRLNGKSLAIDAIWTEVAGWGGATRIPLRVTVRSSVLSFSLDGQLGTVPAPEFSGQAEFMSPSLRRFLKWVGLGRGIGDPSTSISLAGPLEWSPSRMAFAKAAVAVNGNQATGAMTVKTTNGRLSLDGTLGFQELDLGRSWTRLAPQSPPDGQPHVLTVLDADLRLSAAKVHAPALEMGRAAISIALSQGQLQADMAELEIEGGIAGGQLSVDLNQPSPQASIKVKLKGVDAGRALAAPLRRNALLGRSNMTFEGNVGGGSPGEALPSIAGRGHFELAEPGRLGIDVVALVHAARDKNIVSWAAAGKGATPVDALSGRFRVLNGALTIEAVQARSGNSVLVASGRLDVPGRLMDISVATGPAGTTGEAPLTARDILLLRGTWDAPAISLMPLSKHDVKVVAPARSH